MRHYRFLAIFLSFFFLSSYAQYEAIPLDSAVRYGKLSNGLTYYIRHNARPEQRANFYIVQNVGAILEQDSQNGLAHFLEHMAFNGTKNFPSKGIIEYMQSIGAKFGTNVNAYTSLDQTVYMLRNIPTPRPTVIDSSILILHDWSNFISLESDEIDKERGVIREEWRTGSSAARRLWKEGNKLKYPGSQYAKRDVIGDTAVINNFKYDTLRAYYHKWYRPDLQAIVIVGDIDVDYTEKKKKNTFSDIQAPADAAKRIVYPIHDNDEPIVSIVTDPEADVTTLGLEFKKDTMPASKKLSKNGYLELVTHNLICAMLNERFKNIAEKPNSSFVNSYVYYSSIARSKDAFLVGVVAKDGQAKNAFKDLLTELERVKRFGFLQSEFNRAKANYISSLESLYNERDKQNSSTYMDEYINHFLEHEPSPGIAWEYNFAKNSLFNRIDLQIVNKCAQTLITNQNLIVDISAADKDKSSLPSADEVKADLSLSARQYVKPYEEKTLNKPLMSKSLSGSSIAKMSYNPTFQTTEIKLSNGVSITLKPTNFKNDQIVMQAVSDGGTSVVSDTRKLMSVAFANQIASNNGIGDFSNKELKQILAGKNVSFSTYINTYNKGIKASSANKDLETMLQLVYLRFSKPRKDKNTYASFMNELHTFVANSESDPSKTFSDSISVTLTDHSPRSILVNSNTIKSITQSDALKFYKDQFSDADDFNFIFVGSFNVDSITPLICKYLGSIKTKDKKENWVDNNVRYHKGVVTNRFSQEMRTHQTSVYLQLWANILCNVENSIKMQVLRDILYLRYTESLREEEGGTYGAHVGVSLTEVPQEQARLYVTFDTDPKLEKRLVERAWQEIETIAQNGPSETDLNKTLLNLKRNYMQNIKENSWWISTLVNHQLHDLNFYSDYEKIVNGISTDDIKQLTQALLSEDNRTSVIMVPK